MGGGKLGFSRVFEVWAPNIRFGALLGAGGWGAGPCQLHPQPGAAQGPIYPLSGEFLVALVNRDLFADHRDLVLGHVFGVTPHLIGVAELVISPLLKLRLSVLAGQGPRAHGTELG